MQWLKQKKQTSWTAMHATSDHTFIAKVSRPTQTIKPYIEFAAIEPVNIRQSSQVKVLSNKYQLKKSRCSYMLDFDDYQLLQLEKPEVAKDEQKGAVRWKLKDMIDYPVENATIELLDIPTDPAYQNRTSFLYALVAKNTLIGDISNGLLEANINLQAIDVKVIAQRNIASLLEQQDRGIALLSFCKKGALLTFTSGGELYHARFIEIEDAQLSFAIDRISLELQRSLDHFDRQFPYVTVNKLLIAPFETRDSFITNLRDALYIQVESFELSDIFDFSDQVNLSNLEIQSKLLPVLGAALRNGEEL